MPDNIALIIASPGGLAIVLLAFVLPKVLASETGGNTKQARKRTLWTFIALSSFLIVLQAGLFIYDVVG